MSSTFYEIDCGNDEPVVMERRDDGELVFHGWDLETELAAQELGFQPSACFMVWEAKRTGTLDKALRNAARDGHAAVVELLLAAGADVKAKNEYGETALHQAAWYGHAAIVELLLAAGADVDAQDEAGWTALHEAAQEAHAAVVELLLAAGADVNAQSNAGWTALHQAAENGHAAVVELLLAAGADIKAKNNSGGTALHYAAWGGDAAVVELLLAAGADVNVNAAKDEDVWTALRAAASSYGHATVVELIETWIAEHPDE